MQPTYNNIKKLSKKDNCFIEVSNFLYRYCNIIKDLKNEVERNTYFTLNDGFAEVTIQKGECIQFSFQKEKYKILDYIN